jgi:hypothetical protein
MRRLVLLSVSAFALAAWAAQPVEAARVCKEVCSHGVCSKRCVSDGPSVTIRHDRDRVIERDRGYRDRGEVIERRERRPGVEVDTPIGDVRVR